MEFAEERDGLELCAVAFSKAYAMYREGSTEHYEVLAAGADAFEADTENGPRGYPPAPEKNRWNWLPGKHPFASASKGSEGPSQGTGGAALEKADARLASTSVAPSQRRLETSTEASPEAEDKCPQCGGELARKTHYHSSTDAHGFPVVLCCACAVKGGGKCPLKTS